MLVAGLVTGGGYVLATLGVLGLIARRFNKMAGRAGGGGGGARGHKRHGGGGAERRGGGGLTRPRVHYAREC